MAFTFSDNGNVARTATEADAIAGRIHIKGGYWFYTSATAGTSLVNIKETSNDHEIFHSVAGHDTGLTYGMEFIPEIPGWIDGITVDDLDVGHVVLFLDKP